MPLSPSQLRLIHLARRAAGVEDSDYRTALRTIAGVESSKDLTLAGFEDMLAWFESVGWKDSLRHAHYWRDLQANRARLANSRQLHLIQQLAVGCLYPLASLVEQQSSGRTREPSKLTPREADHLIEALKAIKSRSDGATKRRSDEGNSPPSLRRSVASSLPDPDPSSLPDDNNIPF